MTPGGVKAAGPSLREALTEGLVTGALPYGKSGRRTVFHFVTLAAFTVTFS